MARALEIRRASELAAKENLAVELLERLLQLMVKAGTRPNLVQEK